MFFSLVKNFYLLVEPGNLSASFLFFTTFLKRKTDGLVKKYIVYTYFYNNV